MTTTRLIAIGTAGIALICTAPIISTLAQLAAGAFLDWAGAVRETVWFGEPCTPYHNASDLTGVLVCIILVVAGYLCLSFAVDTAIYRSTKEKP